MNHGGGKIRRVHEISHLAKRKCTGNGDEFARAIAKIAVAQICECAGFQTFQQSAIETLSDVTIRYIHNIGKNAQAYANLAGRAECNAFDIIQGLEDLGAAQGFVSASDVDHCLASSGIVRELSQYVGESDDIPFAYDIPHFPVVKDRKPMPSFFQIVEEPPGEHIPAWLPKFPDKSTYVQLTTGNGGDDEYNMKKTEQPKDHRKADRSLLNFPYQFTCNGSERPSSSATTDGCKVKQVAQGNPFLATPVQFGDKEVSQVVPPSKHSNDVSRSPVEKNHVLHNHASVLEIFSPTIEALKSGLCDSEDRQKRVLLNQRPIIQFKIGVGKKPLDKSLDLSAQNKGAAKVGLWFGKDNDKDNKKRRAEEILKQSMECSGELA